MPPIASRVSASTSRSKRARSISVAAIPVAALVHLGVEELAQNIAVRGIDIDDVHARLPRPERRRPVPAAELANVVEVHARALPGRFRGGQARGRQRHLAREHVGRAHAAIPELGSGQRAMRVNGLRHGGHVPDVALVPQAGEGMRNIVRRRMNGAIFGVDHAPAALGLDAPHGSQGGGQLIAHAGAMRHLVEAVGRRDGPDLHRLEQDVESRIARHDSDLPRTGRLAAIPSRTAISRRRRPGRSARLRRSSQRQGRRGRRRPAHGRGRSRHISAPTPRAAPGSPH